MPVTRKTLVPLAIGLAALGLAGCGKSGSPGASGGNDIVIGEYGSLTGSKADFGITTDNGVQLAADEINAAGGILGRKVRIDVKDDAGDATQVGTIVTRFTTGGNVDAVIGEVASKLSLRAAPICERAGVPMISPSSTNPEVTAPKGGDARKYVFRMCYTDPFQGGVLAKFATNTLHAKRAAVLRDISNDYSVGLADFFSQEFKRLGGTIVLDKSCNEGDDNFRPQLTAIAAAKPDVIIAPVYYREIALIARQAREAGITAPFLGGDGWDSPSTLKNAGGALDGSYMSNHYAEEQGGERIEKFVAGYQKKFNTKPNALAALGYDALKLYADAVERAGGTDKAKVAQALADTKGYLGVTGDTTMDKDHNPVKDAVILRAKNGSWEYVTTVKP
jgi:branched-chain amino acid transport system substrate-binding protein